MRGATAISGLLAGLFLSAASGAQAAELRLDFPGLKAGGQVVYAVFDSEAKWNAARAARVGGALPRGQTSVRVDLPPGTYAVMAYHDRNSDQKLGVLPVGLPTEPYGFSNNSRGMFGPPAWSEASFRLDAKGASQTIRLR